MSVITIVGAGMMGSAMSVPAADNGHEVRLVGTPLDGEIIKRLKEDGYHITLKRNLPKSVTYYSVDELDRALDGVELVIGGVSSFGVEWFGSEVLQKIPRGVPVLSITKGLYAEEDGTLVAFPDYLTRFEGGREHSFNAVGGPCISFEIADRIHTFVAFCGHDMNVLKTLKEMLSTEYYHINLTTDVMGLETAVAMKNAYALGVSLAIGMGEKERGEGCAEKYNPQAALFAQSVREMKRLLKLAGGNSDEILYGAGDLYVTIYGGRTRRLGILLGRGLTFPAAKEQLSGVTLESVAVTKAVIGAVMEQEKRGKAKLSDYPLLSHIYDMLIEKTTVNIPWKDFEEEK
ncbi:MAG: glycerol-3-phosphate dehydrogenase [Clostridiales bacterium]|nr:glycerol-3-phosphate dehydrogenase [Clostridiales bacterium]